MRRFQLPLVSSSQAFVSALVLLIFVTCVPARAQAQLTITSTSDYGSYGIGEVNLGLTATGGSGIYTWSIPSGIVPGGLHLGQNLPSWFTPGITTGVSGLATTPGTYVFTVQVDDGLTSVQQQVQVKITSLVVTSSWTRPDAFVGLPYSAQFTAAGGNGSLTWTATQALPPGLSLASDGTLSGTPTTAGFFNLSFSVSDGFDTFFWGNGINIYDVAITTNGQLPYATVFQSYNESIVASGGSGGHTFSIGGGLPNGLSFNNGTITGTPIQSGRWPFSVTATDSSSHSYTKNMTLVVVGQTAQLPQVMPYGNRLDDCSVGIVCDRGISNFSSAQPPLTWSASGLPGGMSIRTGSGTTGNWISPGDAEISGAPSAAGDYLVTITVTDATGASATNTFPFHVSALARTTNLPPGTVGVPYPAVRYRLIGGSGFYAGAVTGGRLPMGMFFDGGAVGVSGTPTEGGRFTVQFTYDDGAGNVLTFTDYPYIHNVGNPSQQLSISSSDLGTARVNQPWQYTLNACCRPTHVWSLESGSLPAGLSLSSSGVLSGTPTVSGQHTFVVRAADGSIPADYTTRQLTLNVTPVFISTNQTLPFGNASVAYGPAGAGVQLEASGGTGPYTWTLATGSFLPPGLSLTSNGLLSGTPSGTGQFNFTVNVLDVATLNRAVGFFSIAIYPFGAHPPLAISTNGNFGTSSIGINQRALVAQNGSGTYTWSLANGTLPPGLSLRPDGPPWFGPNASGAIAGIATTPGTYTFTLRVDDGVETRDLPSTMTIAALTMKDLWSLPNAFSGVAYSHTLTALGNTGAASWAATVGMPPGLSIGSSTGTISGTPTAPGSYNVQISVSADGVTVSHTLSIGVYAIDVGTSTSLVGGAPNELPNATQGQSYSATLTASGGTGAYTFSSNPLPNGLSLEPSTGVVSGIYNGGSQRYWFSITATDNVATSYTRSFAIRGVASPVVQPAIGINGGRFDDCTFGMSCSRGMWVPSGAPAPFTWSASGLPSGMSLRQGGVAYWSDSTPAGDASLQGVPTELGDFEVLITVIDANGAHVSNTFPLHVSELSLDTRLPNGTYATGYGPSGLGAQLRVVGGTASYTTTLMPSPNNRLPAGLSLDGAQNRVTGSPLETGNFSPDLLITDDASPAHQLRLFNYISIAGPGISTIQINSGSDLGYWSPGSNFNFTFSACCVPSYAWSLADGSLPPGTSLNPNTGQLAGTLTTTAGTYSFVLRVSNANDASNFAVRQFTLVVSPLTQPPGTFTLPFGNVGTPYNHTLQVGGATGAVSFALAPYNSVLPPGLALSSAGQLSGTPTSSGHFTFSVDAADSAGYPLRLNLTLAIYPAGGTPPVNLTVGPTFSGQVIGQITISLSSSNTSGGVPPYRYSLSPGANIIPGMRVQDGAPLPTSFATQNPVPTAAFIGVIETPGTYSTSIRVTDSLGGTFDRPITIIVSPLNILPGSQLPRATVYEPYSYAFFAAAGGTGPYVWSATNVPAGLSIDANTGVLSGTPTSAGIGSITVTVTDLPSSASLSSSLTLARNAFAITNSAALPPATNGQSYSQQLLAPGCVSCGWSVSAGSTLPGGLGINNTSGLLSGSPSVSGTFTFTIRATGSGGLISEKLFAVFIGPTLPQALSVTTSPTLSTTTVGSTVTTQINAAGGQAPYSWSLVSGALPPGVLLTSAGNTIAQNLGPGIGYLVGKPLQTGVYTFTLRVTDAVGAIATRTFSWSISALNLQYASLPVRDSNGNLIGPPLTRGVAYSQPVLAIGGTGEYTWTATMPAGLTLNASTGVVSGTPLDSGSFNVPVAIADNGGHSLVSNQTLTIGGGTGPTFGAGATQGPFAQGSSVTIGLSPTGGAAPYTITALTPLPVGFALQAGNAVLGNGTPGTSFFLAGAPMATGVFTFTLQVMDLNGDVGQRKFTLTVSPVSILASGTLSDGSAGAPYSAQLTAFDSAGVATWSVPPNSGIPAGLTLSEAGLLSGTPTTAGNYTFNLLVTDSATGIGVNSSFSLKISPLGITGPATLPMATVGTPYSYTFGVTGAVGGVTWSIQAGTLLPSGLTFSTATGTISGTPLGSNSTTSIALTATNGLNSVLRRFTLFVRPRNLLPPGLPLLQTLLPDGTVGQSYSASMIPNSGLPPFTWSLAGISTLPPGLSLVSGAQLPPTNFPGATIIAGQPTVAGQYTFDLIVTDANALQAQRTFTIRVSPITILSGNLRLAIAGQLYQQQLIAVGGTPPYSFSASLLPGGPQLDLLPPGITLSASGLLSGTTASTGAYTPVIRVQDAAGNSFSRNYSFNVNNTAGLRVSTTNPTFVNVGGILTQSLSTNGLSTYSWSVSGGTLPPGVTIVADPVNPQSVMLTGPPLVAGVYTYTLRATDTASATNFADHTFTMNVSPMQPVSPQRGIFYAIPDAQVGVAYSASVRLAGGTPPYSFSVSPAGPLPPGLTVDMNGVISGTPAQPGVFTASFIASDSAGRVYHVPFLAMVVTPTGTPSPLRGSSSLFVDTASVGVAYTRSLKQQRGGVEPFTWTLAPGSSLPPGVAIASGANGVPDYLTGVPTTAGIYTFDLTVTDSIGQSDIVPHQVDVSALALTPASLPVGRVGVAYSTALAPVGGVGPYTIQLAADSGMVPGLTLSAAGVLAGTPAHAGIFGVNIQVTDSAAHTFKRTFGVYIDNAIGEAPAVQLTPRSIQLSYTQTFADPGAIAIGVTTTSGTPAYNVAIEGIPGATLSSSGGTAPGSLFLDLHLTTLPVGTFTGVLALRADASSNLVDQVPVTVTVASLPPCIFGMSPSSTTIAAAGGSGTFDLSTAGHCSWAASVSQPSWISLTSASSGTGAAALGFTVTSNPLTTQRSGTITVNGSVFTISQFGSACSFVINPGGLSASAAGGIASVGVTASVGGCSWVASSMDVGVSPSGGSGNGTVTVTVPPNPVPGMRQLTALIAGQTFTVIQQGIDCTVVVDPSSASFADAGGIGNSTITTPAACGYDTTSVPSWVTINSGGSGTGPDTLQYTVDANSATTPRTGSIVVGGQTLTISQGAAACSVTLDTAALGSPFGVGGGNGAIGVIANGDNCAWSVSSDANWATFAPNASSGSGTVSISVAPNPSVLVRTAMVSIAGQTVSISQGGVACSYALQSSTGSVPAAGGSGSVGVLTPGACAWSPVSSDPSWLNVGPGATGSAPVSFIANANPNPSPRSATITVAALVYTVTQAPAPCVFTLGAGGVSVSGDGIVGASFSVTSTSPACTPAPVSYANWVTIDGTSFAGTSGTVTFSVQPNPLSVSRTGSIQVGNRTFTITENLSPSACHYSLHAYGAVFNRGGGGGDVFGSASALGCDPTATIGTDQPSFITLFPLTVPVNDIFTLPFNVTPFDTPLTAVIRRARITFGGQTFVVKQVSW